MNIKRNLPLFIIIFILSGCSLIRRATYPEPRVDVVSPPPSPLGEVELRFSGGSIFGWLNESVPSTDSTPVVLYLHGNGENLQTMLRTRIFGDFARLKVHLLAIDYPGYGNSSGIVSEKTIVESVDSAFIWLTKKYPSNPRFIVGFSMGAAVGVQIGSKYSSLLDGMVLISPWTSLDSVAVLHYPRWLVSMVLKDRYNSEIYAPDVETPVIVLHGELDKTIPIPMGKHLASLFPQLKKWQMIKGAGHNDMFIHSGVWEEIADFLFFPDIDWSERE